MKKIIISLVICLCIISGGVAIIFAGTSQLLNVSFSLHYEPNIEATVKLATSDSSNASTYYSGTGTFPASTTTISTTNPSSPESSLSLNCDNFSIIVIYIQVSNNSVFSICTNVAPTTLSGMQCLSIENVNIGVNEVNIVKLVLKSTLENANCSASLDIGLVRSDGLNSSSTFDNSLQYTISASTNNTTYSTIITKTTTNFSLTAYDTFTTTIHNGLNSYNITQPTGVYIKVTNYGTQAIILNYNSTAITINSGATSTVVATNTFSITK